jgi:hypothetical protein
MTPEQRKRFYFPIWGATAAALDWRMTGGRLSADLSQQLCGSAAWPDHARDLIQGIIASAEAAAGVERRAANADDLRHACNRVASGNKHSSSGKFSQHDLNRFDRLCAVLRNLWDLTATIAWLDLKEDDRMRTIGYLKKLTHEGRLIAIARNAWHTTFGRVKDRDIRQLASESPNIISGQRGYKHVAHATAEEINHAANWLESQAKKMSDRAGAIRRTAHRIFG